MLFLMLKRPYNIQMINPPIPASHSAKPERDGTMLFIMLD